MQRWSCESSPESSISRSGPSFLRSAQEAPLTLLRSMNPFHTVLLVGLSLRVVQLTPPLHSPTVGWNHHSRVRSLVLLSKWSRNPTPLRSMTFLISATTPVSECLRNESSSFSPRLSYLILSGFPSQPRLFHQRSSAEFVGAAPWLIVCD